MVKPDPEEAGDGATGRRSLGDSWTETIADARSYVRAEAMLLQTETAHNLEQLRWSLLKAGAGALFLMAALVLLTTALAAWLARLIGMVPTLLLLAGSYLLLGLVLVRNGSAGISFQALVPQRSLARLSRLLPKHDLPGEAGAEARSTETGSAETAGDGGNG